MLRLVNVDTPPPRATVDVVAAGLRAFFKIGEKWGLKYEHQSVLLGQPPRSTFYQWKKGEIKGGAHIVDLSARLSYVLGIFKALEILYSRPDLADRWVSEPNLAFGGQSALERMMGGQITDLAAVRDYLDSVRGGW